MRGLFHRDPTFDNCHISHRFFWSNMHIHMNLQLIFEVRTIFAFPICTYCKLCIWAYSLHGHWAGVMLSLLLMMMLAIMMMMMTKRMLVVRTDGGENAATAPSSQLVLVHYNVHCTMCSMCIRAVHTCKKRVMLRGRLFWPKKNCGKSA